MQAYKTQTPLSSPFQQAPNLPYYFNTNQPPLDQTRVYKRRGFSLITTLTLPCLWVLCAALWVIRYVPAINQTPLPKQTTLAGPIAAAAVALVYANWMKTILAHIAIGELENNLGRSRQWLDAMTGNTAFATNFRSGRSIAIFVIISSASMLSSGFNYALTVEGNALRLQGSYRTFLQYPQGSCSRASNDVCPSREALPTTYTVDVYSPQAAYMVDGRISYSLAAAGASAGDVEAAIYDSRMAGWTGVSRGSVCASVPSSQVQLYTCRSIPATATSTGVTVGGNCNGAIAMTAGENGAMGWQRCSANSSLPTYVIAATDGYARNLQLAMALQRAVGNDPSAYAIQCDPTRLSPTGRQINFVVSGGDHPLIQLDSDGTTCSARTLTYAGLADVSLDLMLGQFSGLDGWMDALMKAAAGASNYGEVTELVWADMTRTPIEVALSLSMAGVLSQANAAHYAAQSLATTSQSYYFTPSQLSFRQLPIGQAIVSLVVVLATVVYVFGRRYKIDNEWQSGNLTLRLLSIDPIQVTGGQLCNATNKQLRSLDKHRLGAIGQHICLVSQGEAIENGASYGNTL